MKKDLSEMKVAIVHDYLHVYGGAEGVVNAIWELFPQADIYSATCEREALDKAGVFKGANIIYPQWRENIPGRFKKFMHKVLIANLPFYFGRLDLSEYDLIISSTAHFAKGVKTNDNQIHVSYIHTPPRFLYGYKGEIRKRSKWYWKILLWPLDSYLRAMDRKFAERPDYIICNSEEVQSRIKKIYNRNAKIINPFPEVEVSEEEFEEAKQTEGKYFLSLSRLAEYKNVDLAIKVCGKHNLELKVAGTGPAEDRLKQMSLVYTTVDMLGFVGNEEKKHLYKNCIAMICAVEDEDFGMAPLEPMMYGKPVIALKQGGYLETVNNDVGIFFDELTEESLENAINKLYNKNFNPQEIRNHALKFNKDRFKEEFYEYVEALLK